MVWMFLHQRFRYVIDTAGSAWKMAMGTARSVVFLSAGSFATT